ncbi:hypothetical protein SNE40_018714 [Patella caerulea]|uniref:Uncharacterized protein n=1 Tax=Patella caerulea TaxID=87958 RepID=A0AAN8P4F6_PATCE
MKTLVIRILVVFATTVACSAFFFSSKDQWTTLKVKFGVNLFDSTNFNSLPRTVDEAEKAGFTKISECENTDKFRGKRYIKDEDHAVVVLFDKNGYIAGLQAGVETDYPFTGISPPFIKENGYSYITAYFVDPSTICETGRSKSQFEEFGTGTNLYIQTGNNPKTDNMLIPRKEAAIGDTKWTKGKCFPAMGVHYWYDLSADTDCEKFFPVFLLYNGGELNGLGWAFISNLPSTRYEHPPPSVFGKFMEVVPTCLEKDVTISTMHIYLTPAMANTCWNE